MNDYKKFLRNFIFSALGISFVIVSFCILADPYEVWHICSRQGFNLYSVKGENIERLTKPMNFIFHHKNSQTIILGSSRSDIAINPETWQNLTDNETYNFSVFVARIYELYRYLEHTANIDKKIENVILFADFFSFIDSPKKFPKFIKGFDDEQIGRKFPTLSNLQNLIFSWNVVKDVFLNCKENFEEKPNYPCHELNGRCSEGHLIKKFTGEDYSNFLHDCFLWQEVVDFPNVFLDEEQFQSFQKIVELCKEKNIKLYVCILPLYPLHYELLNQCWEVYDAWKVKLVSMHDVYDFTCFDENLMQRQNFWDSSHAKSNIGDMILNALHSGNLTFGELLTSENVQQHNHKISLQREIWRKNHSEEIEQALHLE